MDRHLRVALRRPEGPWRSVAIVVLGSCLLLTTACSIISTGSGATVSPPPVALSIEGPAKYGVHVAALSDEIVLEARAVAPDGSTHPTAVFAWRYPGKTYRGMTPTPDPDLSFVEEKGANGLQRLRIRSSKPKHGGLSVGCSADIIDPSAGISVVQATCHNQALRFWGGPVVDIVLPFPSIDLGVGEVRAIEPLLLTSAGLDGEPSHLPLTCSSADPKVATVSTAGSRCVISGGAPGTTTLTLQAGTFTRPVPVQVKATPLGPPPLGAVTDFVPQSTAAPGLTPIWIRSGSADVPSGQLVSDATGRLAFGARLIGRQAVFEWTGSGFGWTLVTTPDVEAYYPPTLTYDGAGTLYAVSAAHEVLSRKAADAPGTWSKATLPASAPVEGVEDSQLDNSHPFVRRPAGSEWVSAIPRSGGGAWVAWVATKGWDVHPDRVCRFVLELAEVKPDLKVQGETVLTAQKQWHMAVSGGAAFDCLRTPQTINDFIEPVPQLLAEGAGAKPDFDLWRTNVTFPFDAAPSDTLTLSPPGLTQRHVAWNGSAWTSDTRFADGSSRAVARSLTRPPLHLGDTPKATYTQATTMRARPYASDPGEPERWFYFDDPRLLYVSSIGGASTPLPGGRAFELDYHDRVRGWRVVDLVADQPKQQLFPDLVDREGPVVRPPVVLPDGRRFAFSELWETPYLSGDPGAKVFGAASRQAAWTVAAEPGASQVLPPPFEALKGRGWALPGEVVIVAADQATSAPLAGRSADGATWTLCPSGPLPSATAPATALVRSDGSAFALAEGAAKVWRSSDVRSGTWTALEDLHPVLATVQGALSSIRRDLGWVEAADGASVALLAVVNGGGGGASAGPWFLVRRYSKAGTWIDGHLVRPPAAIQPGLGDRFEPSGAALVGDKLYVQQAITGLQGGKQLALSPLTLDLGTETWTTGAVVATIYGADALGQNHWHAGLLGQVPGIERTAFGPLVFQPLADGRIAVFGSAIQADGREAVFYASSPAVPGLTIGARTLLRPSGGFHQRLVGIAAEPDGGWFVLYGDGARPLMQFGALEHAWEVVQP